jgi:hypothetical protein
MSQLVSENSENLLRDMTVHANVVVDPPERCRSLDAHRAVTRRRRPRAAARP